MAYKFPLTGKHSVEYPYTLIDHIDVEGKGEWAGLRFRDYRWSVQRTVDRSGRTRFRALAWVNGRNVYAHQFLTGMNDMDHVDRDPLNNTSVNLRKATRSEQNANRGMNRRNTSGLIGVSWFSRGGKWRAYVGKSHIGMFDDKYEAARARDRMAFGIWGERVTLNFPDEVGVTA